MPYAQSRTYKPIIWTISRLHKFQAPNLRARKPSNHILIHGTGKSILLDTELPGMSQTASCSSGDVDAFSGVKWPAVPSDNCWGPEWVVLYHTHPTGFSEIFNFVHIICFYSYIQYIYIYMYWFQTFIYVVRHLFSIASYLYTGLRLGFFRSWPSLYPPFSFSSVFLVLSFARVVPVRNASWWASPILLWIVSQ